MIKLSFSEIRAELRFLEDMCSEEDISYEEFTEEVIGSIKYLQHHVKHLEKEVDKICYLKMNQ